MADTAEDVVVAKEVDSAEEEDSAAGSAEAEATEAEAARRPQ